MNYYERHLGDYARDTAHLSLLEHGIYTLLLDRYYATETPISSKDSVRVTRPLTKKERDALKSVLDEFFTLEKGVYRNRRADDEIAKARTRIDAARGNGLKGGRPKSKPTGLAKETQRDASGLLLGSISGTQQKALHAPYTIQEQEQEHSLRSQRAREADEPNPQPSLNPESWRLFREHHAELGKWSGARESLAAGQCRAMIAQGIDPNPVLEWATARSLADLTDAHRRMTSDRHASNGNGHAAPTASPPRKPGIDRGADETPLERQLAWLRHQAQLGAITPEQHVEQARSARERLSVTP